MRARDRQFVGDDRGQGDGRTPVTPRDDDRVCYVQCAPIIVIHTQGPARWCAFPFRYFIFPPSFYKTKYIPHNAQPPLVFDLSPPSSPRSWKQTQASDSIQIPNSKRGQPGRGRGFKVHQKHCGINTRRGSGYRHRHWQLQTVNFNPRLTHDTHHAYRSDRVRHSHCRLGAHFYGSMARAEWRARRL